MTHGARASWAEPCVLVPAALAAALRGAQLLLLAIRDPLFLHPLAGAWSHQQQAQRILADGWLLPGTPAYYQGPLDSYLLAFLFAIFGPSAGVVVARILSLTFGTLTVFLVARLAMRLAGNDPGRGRRAAWIAGGAAAVYGPLIDYDATLLVVPLVTLLSLISAERLQIATRKKNPAQDLALAGVILGVASITQASALIVLVVAALWALFFARRRPWPGMQPWRAAALLLVPGLLVITPVSLRNTFYAGDPVLVSWSGGIKLFIGNDPAFDQESGGLLPDFAWKRIDTAPGALGLTRGSEHQRFFLRQTLRRTLDRPVETAAILAHKVVLLFSAHEIPDHRSLSAAPSRSPILAAAMWSNRYVALPLSLALPLIAAGLVLGAGVPEARGRPLLVLAAAWAAIPVLFFVTASSRLPAIVVLIPAAAAGWSSFEPKRKGRLTWSVLAALLAFALATVSIPRSPSRSVADGICQAELARQQNKFEDEIKLLSRAVEHDPLDPLARMRLGDAYARRGSCGDAMGHFEEVRARGDLAADWRNGARLALARCLREIGHLDEAARVYTELLDAEPDRPRTGTRPDFLLRGVPPLLGCRYRLERLRVYGQLGRIDEAVADAAWVLVACEDAAEFPAEAQAELRRLAGR